MNMAKSLKGEIIGISLPSYPSAEMHSSTTFRNSFDRKVQRIAITFFAPLIAFIKTKKGEEVFSTVGLSQGHAPSDLPAHMEREAREVLRGKNNLSLYVVPEKSSEENPSNDVCVQVLPVFNREGEFEFSSYATFKVMGIALSLFLARKGYTKPLNHLTERDFSHYYSKANQLPVTRIITMMPFVDTFFLTDQQKAKIGAFDFDENAQAETQKGVLLLKRDLYQKIGLERLGYLAPGYTERFIDLKVDPRNPSPLIFEIFGVQV